MIRTTIKDTLAGMAAVVSVEVAKEDIMTMKTPGGIMPLATFDGEDMRARAMRNLRARLGREPTAADIKAEMSADEIGIAPGTTVVSGSTVIKDGKTYRAYGTKKDNQ